MHDDPCLIFVKLALVYLAVAQKEEHPLRQVVFIGGWLHAYEPPGVAEAAPPVSLIGWSSVVVEGELRLAGHPVDANGLAGQLLAQLALAHVRALELVFVVNLQRRQFSPVIRKLNRAINPASFYYLPV